MSEKNKPAAPEPTATVPVPTTAFAEMVEALVQKGIAKAMSLKTPDDIYEEGLRLQRTRNPPLEEELVPCVSPITKATFSAKIQKGRGPDGQWRVVEFVDYARPDGWDRWQQDGGLVPNGTAIMNDVTNQLEPKFMWEVHRKYYKADNDALMGRPLPPQFRVDFAPAPGSIVLTPDQMKKLGISADQIAEALSVAAE